jgi:GNAT superfamily N-acetyltransferase
MNYRTINKAQYLALHNTITDDKTFKFSKAAISAWDFMKGWDKWDPRVLEDEGVINSICFMKVSGQAGSKVLYICNIFTLPEFRKKGYGKMLLDLNIKEAVADYDAESIRMDCNKKALAFYDSLGAVYWGTTPNKSMFCDLPINSNGVASLGSHGAKSSSDILNTYNPRLRDAKIAWIKKKLRDHDALDYGHPSLRDNFMATYDTETTTLGI